MTISSQPAQDDRSPIVGATRESHGVIPGLASQIPFEWDSAAAPERGIFGFNSRDIRSRPFNLLRSRLLKVGRQHGWRLFGVVSATPGAGKSFVSTNLAAALARSPDIDVYLFDFDLRRSSIAQAFGLEKGSGLHDFLSGEAESLESVAVRLSTERLTIVPSFQSRAASAELLSGIQMDRLIAGMNALPSNAIVICDMPPVFANDDAAIIASKLDGYMLIIEDGMTTKKQVRDSINLLAPAPCVGTILNRFHGGLMSDDYGYGSSKYGEYFEG